MSRQDKLIVRKRDCWVIAMFALALCLSGCGPDLPTVVAALPSLTLAPIRPSVTASPLPTQTPTVSETPTVSTPTPTATPQPTMTADPTSTPQPAVSATSDPSVSPLAPDQSPPTPDSQALARHVRLPILMYHYVEPWTADASTLRQRLTVQPADFAAEMSYLHSQGYVTVSLYDLMAALALGSPLPPRSVVLTFDDGYRTLVDYAAPAMKPYGYTGTVFVVTQLMDENFPQYLTWPQAEALYASGWKIEPHTKTHASLAGASRDYQLYEMLGSVQTVQAHIGTPPRFFAYPYGAWDALTIELAQQMHLWAAVTEIPGSLHDYADRYTLHRVRINGTITLPDFIQTMKAAQ